MAADGREHDLLNDRFVEAKLGNQASHPTAASEQPIGLQWVACTQ